MFSSLSLRTTWSYRSDVRDSGEKRTTRLIKSSRAGGRLHPCRSLSEGRGALWPDVPHLRAHSRTLAHVSVAAPVADRAVSKRYSLGASSAGRRCPFRRLKERVWPTRFLSILRLA